MTAFAYVVIILACYGGVLCSVFAIANLVELHRRRSQ